MAKQLVLAGDLGGLGQLAGDVGEELGPLVVELHVDLGLVELVEARLGALQHRAGQLRLAWSTRNHWSA